MRRITGAIYLSFGFLFLLLSGLDNFYAPDFFKYILILFFGLGIYYHVRSYFEEE